MALQGWQEWKAITVFLPAKRWSEQILSDVGRYQFSSQLHRKQVFETNAHSRAGVERLIAWCSSAIFLHFFSSSVFPAQFWACSDSWSWAAYEMIFFSVRSDGLRYFCPLLIAGMPTFVLVWLCLGQLHAMDGDDFCGSPWAHCFGAKSEPNSANCCTVRLIASSSCFRICGTPDEI